MSKRIDLTGQRFGRLVTLFSRAGGGGVGTLYYCACDCGGHKEVRGKHLRGGFILSCGCLRKEHIRKIQTLGVAALKSRDIRCSICGKKQRARGLCDFHYNRSIIKRAYARRYYASLSREEKDKNNERTRLWRKSQKGRVAIDWAAAKRKSESQSLSTRYVQSLLRHQGYSAAVVSDPHVINATRQLVKLKRLIKEKRDDEKHCE